MPQDLLKIDLDLLYPPFMERLVNCIGDLRDRGYPYRVYSGYRSYAEQTKLYQAFLAGGARAAAPGRSAHNFGLAVDCALFKAPKVLSWAPADYEPLIANLPNFELRSGASYNDRPHINFPNYEGSTELRPLDMVYRNTPGTDKVKLKAVWDFLDKVRK